jgi:hypothetical protein
MEVLRLMILKLELRKTFWVNWLREMQYLYKSTDRRRLYRSSHVKLWVGKWELRFRHGERRRAIQTQADRSVEMAVPFMTPRIDPKGHLCCVRVYSG